MTDPRRCCRTGLRLSAVALVLVGVPAFAATPASALDGTAVPPAALDPVLPGVLASPSPSATPSPSPSPTTSPVGPLPAPVQTAVDALVTAAPAPAVPAPAAPAPAAPPPAQRPVSSNGSSPQQVAAPTSATPDAASDPAAALTGGFGSASLSLGAASGGLSPFTGLAGVPSLGAPMIAPANAFVLPGLAAAAPQTAPEVQIAEPTSSSRPSGTPAGLPGIALAVAVAAAGAATAGQLCEVRRRRVTVSGR